MVSAHNKNEDTKVAVKKVVSAFDDMLVAKRMIREIRLLRQFDHDNIIRIVDMLPPPSVEKFKDVYMVLDRMDTVRHHHSVIPRPLLSFSRSLFHFFLLLLNFQISSFLFFFQSFSWFQYFIAPTFLMDRTQTAGYSSLFVFNHRSGRVVRIFRTISLQSCFCFFCK